MTLNQHMQWALICFANILSAIIIALLCVANLQKNVDKKRRESTISLSVKNALDSFNFLNEMDEGMSESMDSGSMEEYAILSSDLSSCF